MKHILASAALVVASSLAAHAAPLDTFKWTSDPTGSPTCDTASTPSCPDSGIEAFNPLTATSVEAPGNGYGTFVSDFVSDTTYTYSGTVTPTGADNDNIGVVVGWQDVNNNIRLGFEGGGFGDCGVSATCSSPYFANGLWLVQEIAGVPVLLFEDASFNFTRDTDYEFTLTADGASLDWSFSGGVYSNSGTVNPTASLAGNVGVWVGSQSGTFTDLAFSDTGAAAVPLPAGAWLLLSGLGLLGAARVRRRAA